MKGKVALITGASRGQGRAMALAMDVTDERSVQDGIHAVVERYGPIGVTSVWGLATFDDRLYGFTNQGEAVLLDLLRDGGVSARQLGTSPGRAFWGAAARPGAGSAAIGGTPRTHGSAARRRRT